MKFYEALDMLKAGGKVSRNGCVLAIRRGLVDVSGDEETRYYATDEDRAAEDWEAASDEKSVVGDEKPETVAPETVDEALKEVPQ